MKKLFFAITIFCLTVYANNAIAQQSETRPNFLFVYADDQRYDQVGVVQREQGDKGRYPWFDTPNMDKLAETGVRFRNAFASSSLCAPSRAAFLTGRYNHENGVASNFRPLPLDTVTHASLLRAAGYTTAYFGKWHMDSQRERPGFDYHASYIGHGRYFDCPLIVQGEDTPSVGWVDDVITDYAIRFLEEQKKTGKSWSAVVGLKSPHGPQTPPERNAALYEGKQARAVPNLDVQAIYLEKQGVPFHKEQISENGLVPANLDKFRCVKANDQNLGRLLDALDRLGYAENTIVIYTSDNGYYFGEHGLGDKRSAYEESLRIPFLVRFPKLGDSAKGRVVDEPILNIDLAPTLLDYAGAAIPKEIQGRSWRPLLEGKKPADWRKSWFYEYFAERQQNSRVMDVTAVRTLDAKLLKYATKDGIKTDWTELFDLKNDPYELKNLYNDPNYAELRRELEQEYERLKTDVHYRIPDYADRPDWWEYGLPNDLPASARNKTNNQTNQAVKKPGVRLEFTFEKDSAEQIVDSSGKGNHGTAHGKLAAAKGQNGEPAKRFDGNSFIDLKKTPSLVFANLAWTSEVVFHSDKPDGVILAVGGQSQGYSLRLEDGKLIFTTTVNNERYQISSTEKVSGWVKAKAQFTTDRKFLLFVDDKQVAEKQLPLLVPREPNIAYRVGADSDNQSKLPAFSGEISLVKLTADKETKIVQVPKTNNATTTQQSNPSDTRPNIVFIFTDDHAYQSIGAYGSNRNETPNMDRLAREGMRFTNCVVTNSICGPSRAVIQTGKYSHINGFKTNNDRFDNTQQTFPKLLQKAGYQTAIVGKWHLVSPVVGFDYSEILIGQGPYYNPKMIRNGEQVSHTGRTTEIISNLSLEWLNQRDKSKPFLLMLQHKAPHREWQAYPEFYEKYKDRVFPYPETFDDNYAGRGRAALEQDMTIAETLTPLDLKLNNIDGSLTEEQKADWHKMYDGRKQEFETVKDDPDALKKWKYQCYMKDYMSVIASVDDSVGRVLKYIDDNELAKNTIVIYASDQGFYLGEHGWFDKRFMFKESYKTPFIVRWQDHVKPSSVNNDIVSNVDFAETFLDVAGVEIPADMQGRSLVPILEGKTPFDWRKYHYYHYYEYPAVHMVKKHEGVYDGRFKLIHYYDDIDEWELYDLQNDPEELHNAYSETKYSADIQRLATELERLKKELNVPPLEINVKSYIYDDATTNRPAIRQNAQQLRDTIEKRKKAMKEK